MANAPIQRSSPLSRIGIGPKLIGVGAALFVLTRIIKWLPLNWIDGPINSLLWLGIVASVGIGGAITYFQAKRSSSA